MKINQLDFNLIDPLSAGEEWAEDVHNPPSVVEIYIDGIEILEIFRKIEAPYCEAEGHPDLVVGYGHVSANDLYTDLIEATDENSWSYKLGVYPLCCRSCGEPGCWSVTFHVREDEDYIWWYGFEHEHRDWEYNLEFKFLKKDYFVALEKLSRWKEQ